jgi:hypothetical protein
MANTLEDLTLATTSRLYDNWLLAACKRISADSARRLLGAGTLKLRAPYVATADTVEVPAEKAPVTEDNVTVGLSETAFVTFRTQQTISNELLADSDVLGIVAEVMAGEIAETVQGYLLERIGAVAYAGARTATAATQAINSDEFRQLLSSGGAAGPLGADMPLWNCAERKRLMMASHPGTQERYYKTVISTVTGISNFSAHLLMTADRVPAPIFGVPWYTHAAMPALATASTTPQVLAFDPQQVMLAERPVVVALDTESRMGFNQTVIHASYRAAGVLMNPRAAFGLYLTERPA